MSSCLIMGSGGLGTGRPAILCCPAMHRSMLLRMCTIRRKVLTVFHRVRDQIAAG